MKITAIRATPVNIPLEAPFFWSAVLFPGTSKAIVEIETDEGLTSLGGISRTLKFIAACEAMRVGFWCYSGEIGIGSAAYLHVVAATQSIHEPSQSLFRWQTDNVIEEGPFKPKNNRLNVPEGPGLGVTLSPKSFRRCHERCLKEGAYNHYDDPYATDKLRHLPLN